MNPGSDLPQVRTSKLRLGIVGCGAITEAAHLPAALSSPAVEVVALSDTNAARLEYLQRLYALSDIGFVDYQALFDRVDAVVLALPNHLHAPIGLEFLRRGVHVLCEKPLATSSGECQQLCQAARENAATLAVGYVARFFPSTALAKQLIDSNFLGTLHSFEYECGTVGGWTPLSGYNLARSTSGGGVLVVTGSHFIDRMLYFFGPASVVSFQDDSCGGVEANCVAVFRTAAGPHTIDGRVTLSKTHALTNRLRVFGDNGVLELKESSTDSVFYFPDGRELRHEITYARQRAGVESYFRIQLEDFARAICTGGEPLTNGEQAAISVALMEDCYRKASRLEEPWVDVTLERLRTALPASTPQRCPSGAAPREATSGVFHVS
jgi:predicted dehydrogenase